MKIFVKGKGHLELNQNHFITDGGTADIYVKNSTAYKIYKDSAFCISEAKIRELSCLALPEIIKPEDIILNNRNEVTGYTMKFVDNVYSLVQLFPKAFKTREGLNPDKVVKIVKKLQDGIQYIHSCRILLVDINENNFLIKKNFDSVYFIDVDSYETPSFAATAISDLIRDRHSTKFTEESDWFSFAIIAFQLFRGIHPYRGTHSRYPSLDERMLHNISILNQEVKYPKGAVLDESVVPSAYQNWFFSVLEKGNRCAPPNSLVASLPAIVSKINSISGNLFDLIELNIFAYKDFKEIPTKLYRSGNHLIATNKNEAIVDRGFIVGYDGTGVIGFSPKSNTPILAYIYKGQLFTSNLATGQHISNNIVGEALMEYNGRIFFKNKGNLLEVNILEIGYPTQLAGKVVCQILENSSVLWTGCVIQNMLGSIYVTIFPEPNKTIQIHLKELDGAKIIDAKFDGGILQVVALRANKYDRYIFKIFNKDYTLRTYNDVNYTGINFVTLDNGICVSMNEDGSIEAFHVKGDSIKILDDNIINDNILMKDGVSLVIFKNNQFYKVTMKPNVQ